MFLNGHRLIGSRRSTMGVVVKKRLRFGDVDPVVVIQLLGAGLPVSVRRLVPVQQKEGFLVVSLLKPFEGLVRNDFCRVAGMLNTPTGNQHVWVVVGPLSFKNMPMIKTGGFGTQMPLTDNGRLVSRRLK